MTQSRNTNPYKTCIHLKTSDKWIRFKWKSGIYENWESAFELKLILNFKLFLNKSMLITFKTIALNIKYFNSYTITNLKYFIFQTSYFRKIINFTCIKLHFISNITHSKIILSMVLFLLQKRGYRFDYTFFISVYNYELI